MEPTEKSESYPDFEPNQVLSDVHLNEACDYLDEQERLTRANLIGIGIVCGLEIRLDGNSILLSKGCGVTSEGYLVVESEDMSLVSYREYKLPGDPDYPSFKDSSSPPVQYPLWELFPAGETDTTPLAANFLQDKVALLFLELKKEGLRNCSPNNCDDKGSKVTATVRRLLINVSDLEKIIAEAKSLQSGLSSDELEETLLARLNLPDLHLPRYDVPNKRPATTEEVLAAFLSVFSPKIVKDTGSALSSAYEAFKPLLKEKYPADPFSGFGGKFGFLDSMPENAVQVLFLQYYYDFFGDLINAYDEFRWKGTELLCSCCPTEKLFPRHLMLGVLDKSSDVYRQKFLTSPAVSRCEGHVNELKQLFQRIVTMIDIFTDAPPMPKATSQEVSRVSGDGQIRITPSKLGDVPLSDKAIPYYYKMPMYLYWDTEKTRHGRAKQNLSYRSYEYDPSAPDPLRYDMEPYNFLRIEGHLGKDYEKVLKRLIYLKDTYRLPIEIIALRTGDFDKDIAVDPSKEKCRFQDLEAMYDAQREEILSTLCEGIMYLYDIQIEGSTLPGGTPKLPLLKKYAPNYLYKNGTVGAWYEKYLTLFKSISYIDVDQNKIDAGALMGVYCILFMNTVPPDPKYQPHIVSIYYFTKLAEVLPASLDALGYADFENKYQDLMGLIRYFRSNAVAKISAEFKKFIPLEDLIDHFDQVLFSCKLEPVKAIHEEYKSRLREIKQKHFLSFFLQKNPGIQHKAGVPLGGTFIIVYHQNPAPDKILNISPDVKKDNQRVHTVADTESMTSLAGDTQTVLAESIKRIASNTDLSSNPDVKIVLGSLKDWLAGRLSAKSGSSDRASEIISKVVSDLNEGTVIADFFLPYLCCSDCSPVQFILQKIPPTFTAQIGCTNSNNRAEVTIVPKGGEAPYDYKLDTHPFQTLTDKISVPSGSHTLIIRDYEGVESVPQSLTVPEPLAIGEEEYSENVSAQTYTVSFNIIGGNPTYNTESGTITDGRFNSVPVTSGKPINVTIIDSAGCKVTKEFTHVVSKLPCAGKSMRCAYRLWLQPPFEGATYKSYQQDGKIRFRFNGEDIEIAESGTLLKIPTLELNNNFHDAIAGAIKNMNGAIKRALTEKSGADLGINRLVLAYEPSLSDPFGILWIEYFECEKFTVEFDFLFSKPDTGFSLTMRYTNEQTITSEAVLINRRLGNKETRVPAFDCSERDQCLGSEYKKLCDGPDPKTEVTIDPNGENRFIFAGKVNNMPETEIIGWVWDAPIAQPTEPFYSGKKVEAQLLKPGGIVRLTAITKKGCFSFVQENIEQ